MIMHQNPRENMDFERKVRHNGGSGPPQTTFDNTSISAGTNIDFERTDGRNGGSPQPLKNDKYLKFHSGRP